MMPFSEFYRIAKFRSPVCADLFLGPMKYDHITSVVLHGVTLEELILRNDVFNDADLCGGYLYYFNKYFPSLYEVKDTRVGLCHPSIIYTY